LTIELAIDQLSQLGVVTRVSSIYETDPVGFADQPAYLNAVVEIETQLPPEEALAELMKIERTHGRERTFANAPRTLDLDLLLYDGEQLESSTLTLPHPRLHERAFVLVPWNEIAPDARVPGADKAVHELLDELRPITGVSVLRSR
jgi:2-amino-4-hydroxy-6-hydroxymethyldihydropteridine diphosphokinase